MQNSNILTNNFIGLIIDEEDMSISTDNIIKIEGGIYFVSKKGEFPGKNWSDNIITLLDWWTDKIINFICPKIISGKFIFMEGSFVVKLSKIEAGITCLDFLSGTSRILDSCFCDINFLILSLSQATEFVISKLNEKKINNFAVDILKNKNKSLLGSIICNDILLIA
jgi:hypothetical protein